MGNILNVSDSDCIKTCVNDSAKAVIVEKDDLVTYDSMVLNEGSYCVIGPRPECDMRTTYAMMTINSVVCVPRFPKLFGGSLGTTIVACNNSHIYDPQNVLWDFLYNEKVDPWTVEITHQDELLKDGSFRFRCKFNGEDSRGNRYQEHPYDRFHPIVNKCAELIYRAHPNVITKFKNNSIVCDCGNVQETRVSHLDPDDKTSPCSDKYLHKKNLVKSKKQITLPYKCFTLFSPLEDVGRYPPCPNDQFTRQGSRLGSVTIEYTTNENALIEHPLYEDFSEDGIHTLDNKKIY
jgi:hypothetical protein